MPTDKFEFYVAGVKFHRLRDCIQEVQCRETLRMEPEPTNKFDPCAVKLIYESFTEGKDYMIGYVPGKISPAVSALLATADAPICEIIELNPDNQPWKMIKVKILDLAKEEGDSGENA